MKIIKEIMNKENNEPLITKAKRVREDQVLSELIESIRVVAYYDVEMLFNKELEELKAYLKELCLGVIEWQGYKVLVDREALLAPVNLNCEACTKKQEFGCCCGPPCHYSARNLKLYETHKKEIIERLKEIEPEHYTALTLKQMQELEEEMEPIEQPFQLELVDEKGYVGYCEGRCNLLVRQNGIARCLTHLYALEQGLSIYELSPLSCLMFPLEILVILTTTGETLVLLTNTLNSDFTKKFGRWGNYKASHINFQCIDNKCYDGVFKLEDYKPLYEVNKGLFLHEFGKAVYDGVVKICKEG